MQRLHEAAARFDPFVWMPRIGNSAPGDRILGSRATRPAHRRAVRSRHRRDRRSRAHGCGAPLASEPARPQLVKSRHQNRQPSRSPAIERSNPYRAAPRERGLPATRCVTNCGRPTRARYPSLAHAAPGVDPPSNPIEIVQRLPLRWRAERNVEHDIGLLSAAQVRASRSSFFARARRSDGVTTWSRARLRVRRGGDLQVPDREHHVRQP
jgi:hypothetical protein